MAYVIIIIIIITVAYPARAVTWFMSPGVFDVSLGIISELVEPLLTRSTRIMSCREYQA